MSRRLRLTLALLLLSAPAASAQGEGDAAGQWRCRHANRTVSDNNFENWIYEFDLALDAGGGFQAQGAYTAATAGFAVPFMAQGRWQQEAQGVLVQGQEQRQDGTAQPFSLIFTAIGPASMSRQTASPYGNLLTFCQR